MTTLAVKNLLHDKVRLTVTLTGIIFALVLIAVQFGVGAGEERRHFSRSWPAPACL